MTIYLDIIFLENLIMNSIIIYATSIILKIKPKLWRIILASTIGAIYVIIIYITEFSIYNSLLIKMILSIFIVYIAYNPQSAKKMWKELAIFYLTTFVFGGMALYLIYIIKPQEILIENGIYVGSYAIKVIMLGAIFSFVLIKISFNIIKSKIIPKDMMCIIKIKINDKIIETKAMIDTGNFAKEPITNTPVVIVEGSLLEKYIPTEIIKNVDRILIGDFSNISENVQIEYSAKLRCIPFNSLGKTNGMLLGIRADEIKIEFDEDYYTVKNIILGIYDKSLTKRGEYRALIGGELVNM